ncbi:response regulator transcription factor [Metasolibacillus meyeri]|uniref:Response regulator transcription factor n=1 Tax=Metasolibacillus meyeri TaxID=1071052 RepID=A0AAW9NSR2_9BACL|nr:response regulator transcription factor [Metasolibacillus meyeri]MEC1178769.1 response regulator transcription factor [Metasolibacillus meyeri]
MAGEKILIVEDDEDIMEILALSMKSANYTVSQAATFQEGWHAVSKYQPDLILLDVNLPDGNGFQLAEKIREISDAILIFVTVNHQIDEKLQGFEVGADDYVTKPFIPKELVARVQAHLKRRASTIKNEQIIKLGNLEVRTNDKMVYKEGQLINLYTKERQLLFYLLENVNRVLSVEQLINHVWGFDGTADAKTLSVHMSTLRRKIEDNPSQPKYIQTVRGFGYIFSNKD